MDLHAGYSWFWANADLVADETRQGCRLVVHRSRPGREHTDVGFALCWLTGSDGHTRGNFRLIREHGAVRLRGFTMSDVDHVFMFPDRILAETADWTDLVAFVREVVDANYHYPPQWNVDARVYDTSKRIAEYLAKSGTKR